MNRVAKISVFIASVFLCQAEASAQSLMTKSLDGIEYEVGTRYYWSTGSARYTLKDSSGLYDVSRLTWKNATANSGEIFGRIDTAFGLYVKGYVGLSGTFDNGKLQDEDFAPFISPYSSTNSNTKGASLGYAVFDVGYNIWKERDWGVGGFVGFSHFHDKYSAYGCEQTATNPFVCGGGGIDNSVKVITNKQNWNGVRVGIDGRYMITDTIRLSGEAAYLPYVALSASDSHWLRMGTDFVSPTTASGFGRGVQMEAKLDKYLTDNWTVGVGARYSSMWADGTMRFDKSASPVGAYLPQSVKYENNRYGFFLNTSYKF